MASLNHAAALQKTDFGGVARRAGYLAEHRKDDFSLYSY